jgi:hypothetical protein
VFNKTKIAAAVAATALGIAGMQVANAVHVNGDGTGEVLIFPYYNTNNSFQTNVSVTNTTSAYTIFKIRFRESNNSQDVLDFNVYMSPYDVWTGTVRQVDGKANLISDDTTCTYPPNDVVVNEAEETFVLNPDLYTGDTPLTEAQKGWNFKTAYTNVDASDPLEGYIEVFEIGSIRPEQKLFVDSTKDGEIDKDTDKSYTAGVVHVDGMPVDCSVVETAWKYGIGPHGAKNADTNVDDLNPANVEDGDLPGLSFKYTANGNLLPPYGGLYGMTIFLDLINGGAYVADPVAIENWSDLAQHYNPGDVDDFLLPSLASGDVGLSARMNSASGLTTRTWPKSIDVGLNDGDSQTPRSGNNPGPIAHVLATKSLANDYFVDPTFDGSTDWVITFPMRKHGIFDGKWTSDCVKDEVRSLGTGTTEGKNTCFKDSAKDVAYSVTAYNREEEEREDSDFNVSPVLETGGGLLPREVNVVNFTAGDSVLGSVNAATLDTGTEFKHGWARMTFPTTGSDRKYVISNADLTAKDSDGATDENTVWFFPGSEGEISAPVSYPAAVENWNSGVHGVPAIGFAAIRGSDGGASGPTFGETTPHAYQRYSVNPLAD